jgi:DNA-binding MarR family transcriptional regulator
MNESSPIRNHRSPPSGEPDSAPKAAASGRSFIELIQLQWYRERPDLDLSEFLLSVYFMRLGRVIEHWFDAMCRRRYQISGSDMRVLLALRRGGHPYVQRPTDLFRALLVTSGAITKKVDRLSELVLVERLSDPGNNGGFLIHLTRKGLQIADDAVGQVALQSVLAPAMAQFTEAERASGSQFALRTLAALEATGTGEEGDESDEAETLPSSSRRRAKTPRRRA